MMALWGVVVMTDEGAEIQSVHATRAEALEARGVDRALVDRALVVREVPGDARANEVRPIDEDGEIL